MRIHTKAPSRENDGAFFMSTTVVFLSTSYPAIWNSMNPSWMWVLQLSSYEVPLRYSPIPSTNILKIGSDRFKSNYDALHSKYSNYHSSTPPMVSHHEIIAPRILKFVFYILILLICENRFHCNKKRVIQRNKNYMSLLILESQFWVVAV